MRKFKPQPYTEATSRLLGWLHKQASQKTATVGKAMKKLDPFCTVGRHVKLCSCSSKRFGSYSKGWGRITMWPSRSISSLNTWKQDLGRHTCLPYHVPRTISVNDKAWEQRSVLCRWMVGKMWQIWKTECDSDVNKTIKEVLSFCAVWINLKDIFLNEISQLQKYHSCGPTSMGYLAQWNS